MPKPLRDALKVVLKELETTFTSVMDSLRDNLELQQAVHDVVKPASKAMQSARRIFGKTMRPSKQPLGSIATAISASSSATSGSGSGQGTPAEDPEEEALRKNLHQKIDDILGKLHEKLNDERQKRLQAEAEVSRLKGLEDELHRERELRAKAEKDLKKARDEIENLKRKGARGSKMVDEDIALPPSTADGARGTPPQPLSPSAADSARKTAQPATPSPLGTSSELLQLSSQQQAQSPSSFVPSRQSSLYVPLPAQIPHSVQLQSTTLEADAARSIVKSLEELIAQLPSVESHLHLIYIARVARELRKLEHVPLEEDFQFPALAAPSRTPAPGTGPSLDSEQVRGLRQVIPAVLQDVRAFVLALGINTGPNVLRRLRVMPPVINNVLSMLAELRTAPIPPPSTPPTTPSGPKPSAPQPPASAGGQTASSPPASAAGGTPPVISVWQAPSMPQRNVSSTSMSVDMPQPPPF